MRPAARLSLLLLFAISGRAQSPGLLRLTVTEGAGAVYPPGSVSYRGFTVRVTAEGDRAAAGARVTFQLPETGPGGLFPGGARSEEVIADPAGVAAVWGIRWGQVPGRAQVMVFAQHGGASAGMAIPVQIGTGPAPPGPIEQTKPIAPAAAIEPPRPVGQTKPTSPASIAGQTKPVPATPQLAQAVAASLRPAAPAFEVTLAASPFDPRPNPADEGAPPLEPIDRAPEPAPAPARGVIFTRNLNRTDPIPTGGRRKWVAVGLGIAGAVGGGMAYRMLQPRATPPAAAAPPPGPIAPPLSLSAPTITIGKP